MTQTNMVTVLDHIHAMRRRDFDDIPHRLHPDVVHQGVLDDLICVDRDQVLGNMLGSLETTEFGIERLELIDAGERVVVGLGGPRFRDVPYVPLLGQIYIVYTLRDDRIVRMDDYLTRAEALTAAGATSPDWI
ncbi:MAG: hypothetical protein ACR2JC_20350 [Chloroflexota bacterium]|nr:MAG: hypothetical protein DLM70_13310 [Chloroflexota bacterium]